LGYTHVSPLSSLTAVRAAQGAAGAGPPANCTSTAAANAAGANARPRSRGLPSPQHSCAGGTDQLAGSATACPRSSLPPQTSSQWTNRQRPGMDER
jgi:hypothetical protein